MDRNSRLHYSHFPSSRSSYINSGSRSLPHMSSSKRHIGNPRLSPPTPPSSYQSSQTTVPPSTQHDDLINYIYESWNKVTREMERGGEEAKYYQEVMVPRQLANFRPFNLEEWWGRRLYTLKVNKHRS